MSFNFADNGDQINYGNGGNLDNVSPMTACFVWRTTTINTTYRYLIRRVYTDFMYHDGGLELYRVYNGADCYFWTGNIGVTTNTWYVSFMVDNGAGNAPACYHAALGSELQNITASGSTTPTSTLTGETGADLIVGYRDNSRRLLGDMAYFGYWDSALTLGQAKAVVGSGFQNLFSPIIHSHCGFSGTTTQADWSGNGNSGACTGLTISAHAPYRLGWDRSGNLYVPGGAAVVSGLSIPIAAYHHNHNIGAHI